MPEKHTGSGEPSKTLALLWGIESRPIKKGPARSLTVQQVVDAALAIADEDSIDAATIRAVARRLGVSAMSVYTYVPGKPELLDLMVDAAYASMPRTPWETQSWQDRATLVAEANRALLATRPWLVEIASLSRPPLGPGVMAKYEHELAVFDDTGLSDIDIDAALTYLLGFVRAHCQSAIAAQRTGHDTATTDAEWWEANQPLLESVLDENRYPRSVRIGAAAGEGQGSAWDAERTWRFGLKRTLDGLAVLIEATT